jgi:hypothetical protein
MQQRRLRDAELQHRIHPALQAGGFGDRNDAAGLEQSTILRHLDAEDVGCLTADQVQRIGGAHHRFIR